MRYKYQNEIDNFAIQLDNKINKMITNRLNSKNDIIDKDPKKQRDGLLRFGAFQMSRFNSSDLAIFGISSSTVVGH